MMAVAGSNRPVPCQHLVLFVRTASPSRMYGSVTVQRCAAGGQKRKLVPVDASLDKHNGVQVLPKVLQSIQT